MEWIGPKKEFNTKLSSSRIVGKNEAANRKLRIHNFRIARDSGGKQAPEISCQ